MGCDGWPWETEAEGEAAWENYRITASEGIERLQISLKDLSVRDWRGHILGPEIDAQPLPKVLPAPPMSSAPMPTASVKPAPLPPRRVPQAERRAPAHATEIYNAQPALF